MFTTLFLGGKHLHVDCSNGMRADKKKVHSFGGRPVKQLRQLKGREDNVSLASENAFLSQLRNVNSWLLGYFCRSSV